MILKILQIGNMAKEAKQNPGKFAGNQVGGLILDMLIIPALVALLLLGIFFVFGFTSFLGGPYFFFKVLFFLALAGVLFISYFLRKIYRFIKSLAHSATEGAIKVGSKVIK